MGNGVISPGKVVGYTADIGLAVRKTSLENSIALKTQPSRPVIGPSEYITIRTEELCWPLADGSELSYVFTSGFGINGQPVNGYSTGSGQAG